jgi:serine-type D-Ala-D-Ala carboxypeptidase/endopeptidase (penicillin-binding protein 4)
MLFHYSFLKSTVLCLLCLGFQSGFQISDAVAGTTISQGVAQSGNASEAADRVCLHQLPNAIQAIANQPSLRRARWGILVRTLDTGETLYEQDATRYFIPASNAKLFVTAAIVEKLGPQFQIRTSVYQAPSASGTTILRVVGRGDPGFTDGQLRDLAAQLHRRGITHIDQLIADDHYFQGDAINSTWQWDDIQAGYGAPVNSLILNQNELPLSLVPHQLGQPLSVRWDDPAQTSQWQVDNRSVTVAASEPEFVSVGQVVGQPILQVRGQLHVGAEPETASIAILNPAQHFLQRFEQSLTAAQISVEQTAIATHRVPSPGREVASVVSAPLVQLVTEANQNSNNLYAEALLRTLGRLSASDDMTSSLEAGITAVQTILAPLGVDPQGYRIADGSGLSRHTLVTPEALVQTLQAMARSPQASVFRNSLAVAGDRGTLRNRFRDSVVQGRLQGKTGAMSGVATLAGYLNPPHYAPLVFSIVLNQFDQPVRQVRPAIDEMVLLLSRLSGCDQ